MISRVDGCTVSPRKSRRKSLCFSSTVTGMPARASRKPSIIPAGPPPAITQVVSSAFSVCVRLLPDIRYRRDAFGAAERLQAVHAFDGAQHIVMVYLFAVLTQI